MDLSPFYAKEGVANQSSRCPIRIEIIREGKKSIYDPRVDAAVLRGLPVKLDDTIVVKDFRLYPKMIEDQRQSIEQMLWLGSTNLDDALRPLADLQHEYEDWLSESGKAARTSDECLKAEAARLVKEGKGQKIVDLLSVRLGSLQMHGLGPAHPDVKSLGSLIQMFKDLIAK